MVAAIVLAAGGSSRMGRPKQLLSYRGRTLLRRTVDAALQGGCNPVLVVLGASAESLHGELEGLPVRVVVNERWAEGLAGSIRAGVDAVGRLGLPIDAAILMVCDQPRIGPGVIRDLRAAFDGAEGRRVACAYGETVGVPALFERTLFPRLAELRGDRGAQSLLLESPADLISVPWPEGGVDVDDPADWDGLQRNHPKTPKL